MRESSDAYKIGLWKEDAEELTRHKRCAEESSILDGDGLIALNEYMHYHKEYKNIVEGQSFTIYSPRRVLSLPPKYDNKFHLSKEMWERGEEFFSSFFAKPEAFETMWGVSLQQAINEWGDAFVARRPIEPDGWLQTIFQHQIDWFTINCIPILILNEDADELSFDELWKEAYIRFDPYLALSGRPCYSTWKHREIPLPKIMRLKQLWIKLKSSLRGCGLDKLSLAERFDRMIIYKDVLNNAFVAKTGMDKLVIKEGQ